ncbi:hypothetical protein BCR44DRAFT_1153989 [Catenaria anguillulae PL171]|uniref:Uncharacterized protein n=1 Tax=Catenaria anguillulae PL171 TaxID=765915 RepID=A0A1Y2HIS8_9FUNG|nr:hypothetical protein BCR44DRAFT_1153989 [Catenaria anguillulae PL171]
MDMIPLKFDLPTIKSGATMHLSSRGQPSHPPAVASMAHAAASKHKNKSHANTISKSPGPSIAAAAAAAAWAIKSVRFQAQPITSVQPRRRTRCYTDSQAQVKSRCYYRDLHKPRLHQHPGLDAFRIGYGMQARHARATILLRRIGTNFFGWAQGGAGISPSFPAVPNKGDRLIPAPCYYYILTMQCCDAKPIIRGKGRDICTFS